MLALAHFASATETECASSCSHASKSVSIIDPLSAVQNNGDAVNDQLLPAARSAKRVRTITRAAKTVQLLAFVDRSGVDIACGQATMPNVGIECIREAP